jgi:hypothetical protein
MGTKNTPINLPPTNVAVSLLCLLPSYNAIANPIASKIKAPAIIALALYASFNFLTSSKSLLIQRN